MEDINGSVFGLNPGVGVEPEKGLVATSHISVNGVKYLGTRRILNGKVNNTFLPHHSFYQSLQQRRSKTFAHPSLTHSTLGAARPTARTRAPPSFRSARPPLPRAALRLALVVGLHKGRPAELPSNGLNRPMLNGQKSNSYGKM